jgi:VIT1/CCC1 family predicted Fe2+/Mn2+ transporter
VRTVPKRRFLLSRSVLDGVSGAIGSSKRKLPGHRRTQKQRDTFQAAVLGVNDGLVSTLALLLGVAGAGSDAGAVRVAGFASLVAGACSLAVSQYIADQTLAERRHRIAMELRKVDKLDAAKRDVIFQEELVERGIGAKNARTIGDALVADESKSSAILGLLRYGFNSRERGSPVRSASATLVASAGGAIIPIIPWFFLNGSAAVFTSLGLACVAAGIIGGTLGIRSSGRWVLSALRQLLLVILAAAVTYELGRLFHQSLRAANVT